MSIIIQSSNGTLTCNSDGYVEIIEIFPDGEGLLDITRIDLQEWLNFWGVPLPAVIDILDVGYWYMPREEINRGVALYESPVAAWRREIAINLLKRKPIVKEVNI